MTAFVGVQDMARLLAATGVGPAIAQVAERVHADFVRWAEFDKTPRVASHSPIGVIELMPTSDGQRYGFKYVNGHPTNPERGFQTVTAFGALADVDTGYPLLLAEMTLLTAVRTAATSAVAARALARPDARRLALVGAGSQAEFQAWGMRTALGITDLAVFDPDPAAAAKLVRHLQPAGFTVTLCATAGEAVRGADVVTTCTADKARALVLDAADVAPGTHLNAIGGDCPGKTELPVELVRAASVFIEFEAQTRVEGEIQALPADSPVTELWEVLAGRRPGRTRADEVTLFDSVGFAVEDFSALCWLADAVRGTPWSTELDLVADPADPKDLFGLVAAAGAPLPA
ncbi:ornithine cyclodeaminase [Klenkia brasiliensis]|uniref:Ornithine cyclodeaminase n=1 Tax=Klenkia brasiliensis TaxID=333142 RepID=A0A1G7XUC2_9ACTN|nr:ornithine cyclodeaminase [Klenkia brasiliensis]SDG87792.1 ornithine cyclodeaminase [Klenkia brasiliensis]